MVTSSKHGDFVFPPKGVELDMGLKEYLLYVDYEILDASNQQLSKVSEIDWRSLKLSLLDSSKSGASVTIVREEEEDGKGPISLVTNLYKIIAKVLSGRLRRVLNETIYLSQGAFVEGRQILDAMMIANKVVDEKKRSRDEWMVFKIDFEKAYDHVDWGF
ncbi:hypothetical protein CK203_023552 [Vitis vinifera]|uniref:Reverse transcriptase domain-containing protein n=1 Tax=Vitis vinifera TaxID=29760 RepID=A0A438JC08_VITVI|nr:hypothetical protein CK203_023552 [Vitis vinifera]